MNDKEEPFTSAWIDEQLKNRSWKERLSDWFYHFRVWLAFKILPDDVYEDLWTK